MWDRYDARDDDRQRDDAFGRYLSRGSRGASDKRRRDFDDSEDPRDVFLRDLDLPRDDARERVDERTRSYSLNHDDSRTLATVGAFRVVAERDLEGQGGCAANARATLRHLEREGLARTSALAPGERAVVLTDRARDLLEAHRIDRPDREHEPGQAFYAGLRKPRELTHDTAVYRAYARAEARIRASGGRVRRVVLDYEVKRDYQRFLQERNRGRRDHDGRPDREVEEVIAWARAHDLPYFDDQVHIPDARVEYDDRDGRSRHEDLEVVTAHYRGAHAGAAGRSGFTCYRSGGHGVGGRTGGRRTPDPRLAEEFL